MEDYKEHFSHLGKTEINISSFPVMHSRLCGAQYAIQNKYGDICVRYLDNTTETRKASSKNIIAMEPFEIVSHVQETRDNNIFDNIVDNKISPPSFLKLREKK
jgi:hypothetical protein